MSPTRGEGGTADEPMSWPVADTEQVYGGEWVLGLRRDRITRPGHPDESFHRIVVEDPGAVLVLALDEDERVAILRQYRHPVQHRIVGLPAGVLDVRDEDPLEAAKRELREEAALAADEWTHLVTTFATPGKSEETHAIYLARGLHEVDREFDLHHEEAEMTLEWVPVDDLVAGVLGGRLRDAPLAVAVLAYDALRRRGRA